MSEDESRPAPKVFGDLDRAIIEFERLRWKHQGAKESEILRRFDLSLTSYSARLVWILEQREAMAYDAVTVGRLRRVAEQRRQVRTRGTGGMETRPDYRGVRPMGAGSVDPTRG